MLNLTLYMCAENVHIANINVPAGVGAPLLNTQLQITVVQKIDLPRKQNLLKFFKLHSKALLLFYLHI